MERRIEHEDGWCDWHAPIMKGYRLGCCDCGLVHDVEFQIMKVIKSKGNGVFTYEIIDGAKYRVQMRAKRNRRSTAQVRRHLKRKK